MPRGDHTFAISLLVSLMLHAAAAIFLVQHSHPPTPVQAPVPASAAIFVDASEEFGSTTGKGDAANSSPGEIQMAGRDADQAQAFLSRDPIGPGNVGDDPSMSVLPRGANLTPADLGTSPAMIGAATSDVNLPPPRTTTSLGTDDTPLRRVKDAPILMAYTGGDGALASSAKPAADPAILSDSESDPFAPGMTVEFRDGRVDARLGRKVKTVRPKLNLAAMYDLQSTMYPNMRVSVHVNADGAVRRVEIDKSSGSVGADQAVEVALYQWWFEPKKDRAGRAIASVMSFPIVWR